MNFTPGTYVKNLKEPYMGLCIVLDVEGSKVRTFSERGRYDVDATHAQLVESSPETAIFPSANEKLQVEFENYKRRKQMVAFTQPMKKAMDATLKGEYPWAAKQFSDALEIEPDSHEALAGRAHCRRLSRAYADAIDDYSRLVQTGAASDNNYLERALCSEALGKLDEARADAEEALAINENKAQACDLLVRLHRSLGAKHEEDAQRYEKRARQIRNPEGNLGPLFE